ncbi:hypothetical protein Cni_G11822 [Canna indica]|uniref:TPX2 C-terminal domain-containing protein n=1 Tax=Canna indica TaxID=4628 RepID=A0AAQ3K6Z1_9LILI|nr:hypothetical protein Cni_G11822 [Canna indica]
MESGDGVELELNKGLEVKDVEPNGFGKHINKENEMIENGADAVHVDCVVEDAPNLELLNSAGDKDEGSAPTTENKVSDLSKKGEADAKNRVKKSQKTYAGLNGSISEAQKRRSVLSQSFSFPSRGVLANNIRKYTTTSTRQSKVASSISNGELTAKHSAFPATSTAQKTSANIKSGSAEATINGNSVEPAQSCDIKIKPLTHTLPAKKDDDAKSTTSSTTPRARNSIGCTFSFRSDERAEKRKEFFMKLEEKNHAKEMEKNNLQEKSKENQEAEIRQLRKSLNFKATPMPSFYQEPGPPKVELRKIPPTRAKSPKLGRRKPLVTAVDAPSEIGSLCESTHLMSSSAKLNEGAASSKGNVVSSKNRENNSLVKLPAPKLKVIKSEAKSFKTNTKASDLKSKIEKVEVENSSGRPTETSVDCELAELASPENRVEQGK